MINADTMCKDSLEVVLVIEDLQQITFLIET